MSINSSEEALNRKVRPIEQVMQAEIAEATTIENKRTPSSHGVAAKNVREYLEDKKLEDLCKSDDISEFEDMFNSLEV